MNLRQELFAVLVLTACFAALLIATECWARLGRPKRETTRKLVYLGGGLLCLLFPFLVKSHWTVLALAVGMSALFAVGGKLNWLQSLHGVERRTRGSEYYPLAIFLVFVFAGAETWLFVSSVLVLAVADAAAALIGSRYGSIHYTVEQETKSLEGSAVFLMLAFLTLHLTMLLLTDLPREICVLAALTVALLVTGLEAIALSGADNLFVPLGACLILKKLVTKPVNEVLYQAGSLLGICLVVGLLAHRGRAFNVGGTITFILFAYASWSLGSEDWALPVLIGWMAYAAVWRFFHSAERYHRIVRVRLVTRALIIPFLLLVGANVAGVYSMLYGPFLAAVTTALILGLWSHVRERLQLPIGWKLGAAMGVGLIAWGVTSPLPWRLQSQRAGSALGAMLVVSVGVALANAWLRKDQHAQPPLIESGDYHAWDRTCWLLTVLAAVLIMGLQQAQLIASWHPGEASWILRS